jgi:osmotically-inducible protein OsmY
MSEHNQKRRRSADNSDDRMRQQNHGNDRGYFEDRNRYRNDYGQDASQQHYNSNYGGIRDEYENTGWRQNDESSYGRGYHNYDHEYGDPYSTGNSSRNFEETNRNQSYNRRGYDSNANMYGNAFNNRGSSAQQQHRDSQNSKLGNNYQSEPRNRYGGDTSNYGNANQGGIDRSWWDKTRDEVSSWFGDDDADRKQRQRTSGPHRGKGPKGYQRSDERIREDVSDRLTEDDYLDASNVEVSVSSGEVVLSGTVENREDKRRAEDLAERISGVQNVQNNIRVNRHESSTRYTG